MSGVFVGHLLRESGLDMRYVWLGLTAASVVCIVSIAMRWMR